jgi:hypothetical protein
MKKYSYYIAVVVMIFIWVGIGIENRIYAEPSLLTQRTFLPMVESRTAPLAAYRLLVLSDRAGAMHLYTMNGNGTGLRQLSNLPAKNPLWSPDGSQIVFASPTETGDDLYLVHTDGAGLRQISTLPGDEYEAEWSPDGTSILFLNQNTTTGMVNLYTVDIATTTPRFLAENPSLKYARWSPIGDLIAYVADSTPTLPAQLQYQLFIHDLSTNQSQQITDGAVGYTFEGWVEEGKRLLIGTDYPDNQRELYTIQPDGSDLQPFAHAPGSETVHSISADGEHVAYSLALTGGPESQLYQQAISNDAPHPLSIPFCDTPTCGLEKVAFSDDGQQVVYVIWDAISINFSPSQLWVTPSDTSAPPWDASLNDVYSPVWLDDHTLIVHRNAAGAKAYTRTPYLYNLQTGMDTPLVPPEQTHTTVYDVRYLP